MAVVHLLLSGPHELNFSQWCRHRKEHSVCVVSSICGFRYPLGVLGGTPHRHREPAVCYLKQSMLGVSWGCWVDIIITPSDLSLPSSKDYRSESLALGLSGYYWAGGQRRPCWCLTSGPSEPKEWAIEKWGGQNIWFRQREEWVKRLMGGKELREVKDTK
jgi:hypothetical protein